MNHLPSVKCLVFVLIFLLTENVCEATAAAKNSVAEIENGITGPLIQKKKAKIMRPMSAKKAQKQAEAKDKSRKQDSEKYIRENRKRSIEIQTPEVQVRMKQNVKDTNARYKARKKNKTSRARKAGKKYK